MSQPELIVVGAGSAGCVLASRLARRHARRVMLVEPPSTPAKSIDRERPSRWLNLLGSGDDWNLQTEPEKALAGRPVRWPRGRGMGGSSRINAMIWFPPTEQDREMLARASGGRWTTAQLAAAYRSTQLLVEPQQPLWMSEASRRFMRAAGELEDAKPMAYQRVNRQGRRWNPASLLGPDSDSGHPIETVRAEVDRLIWSGDRAIGVRLGDGSELAASAGVVLCAGAIATPTILMRSGVGPGEELSRHGIDVRVQQPSVGNHLQDHLIMPVIFQTASSSPFPTSPSTRDVARWQTLGTGPVGSNVAECGGLFCKDAIQLHVTPTHYLTFPKSTSPSVMTIGVQATQPASRGCITLRSSDYSEPPRINAAYLAASSDLQETIRGVRLARRIASDTSLADWIAAEVLPGAKREDDASIARSIARYAQTLYHPVGTCGMGSEAESAVNPGFELRGTRGLWIADASVLPKLTVGNPNAAIMMLACLAADSVSEAVARQ